MNKTTKMEMQARGIRTSLANYSFQKATQTMLGIIYPSFLFMLIVILNHMEELSYIFTRVSDFNGNLGLLALLLTFLIPIFTDTFAYLTGSLFKGKKLCPSISPNKTISGAIGGLVWSMIGSILIYFVLNALPSFNEMFLSINLEFWHILILGFVGSVACQGGDIFESFLKRKADVKDSGNILPGHGGILDRIDSHIFNVPVVLVFFIIFII